MQKIAYQEMYENEMSHAWYYGTRKLLIDTLEKYIARDSKILDAGCGTGGTILYLKKAGFNNLSGIDISKEAIGFCKKRKLNKIKLASVNKIPYPDEYFNAVLCMDVLYHQGVDSQKALEEFYRVLKKGGTLYVQEPAFNLLKSSHDEVIQTKQRFTRPLLLKLLESAGFTIVKKSYFNMIFFSPIVIKRLFDKFTSFDKPGSDLHPLHPVLNSILLMSLLIEVKLFKFINLPFGLSLVFVCKKD